jgi:hypothetical protein
MCQVKNELLAYASSTTIYYIICMYMRVTAGKGSEGEG